MQAGRYPTLNYERSDKFYHSIVSHVNPDLNISIRRSRSHTEPQDNKVLILILIKLKIPVISQRLQNRLCIEAIFNTGCR